MRLDPKLLRYSAVMSSAVMTKVAAIMGGYWIGHKLDEKWGTQPVLMLVGLCVGLSFGIWYLFRTLERLK